MRIKQTLILFLGLFAFTIVQAEQTADEKRVQDIITKKLQAIEQMSKMKIESVTKGPFPGIYDVKTTNANLWFSEDGNYFIYGDIYQVKDKEIVNLSEEDRQKELEKLNPVRKEKIAAIDPKSFLVFPAKGEHKKTITVATDIDCGFCRKLHLEVPKLNEYGIEVHYMAFPRSGKDTESYHKIVAAWCAENPQEALTKAKAGEEIPMIKCDKSKYIDEHLKVVEELGLRGTPAIILEDGKLLPGYMPADALAAELGLEVKKAEEGAAESAKSEEAAANAKPETAEAQKTEEKAE